MKFQKRDIFNLMKKHFAFRNCRTRKGFFSYSTIYARIFDFMKTYVAYYFFSLLKFIIGQDSWSRQLAMKTI